MSNIKKLMMAAAAGGEILPEGVEIGRDASGYISSTSLSGTSSSATYTFSCWFYYPSQSYSIHLFRVKDSSNNYFEVRINANYNSSQSLDCRFSQGGTTKLAFYNNDALLGQGLNFGWNHLVLSVNNNQNSSAKAYLNDQNLSLTHWANAGFTSFNFNQISIGTNFGEGNPHRMAHAYIDYTYRDLSVTSQRRNFITEDLKPASDQASLNPVVYLPLTNASVATTNEGTGGNFTETGAIDTASRGPNQYNAVASDFNGSNHKLTRSGLTGVSDGKAVTFSANFSLESFNDDPFLAFESAGGMSFVARISNAGSYGYLTIIGITPSETYALQFSDAASDLKVYLNRNHSLQFSFDLTDTSKRHIILDGEEITGLTWSTYNNTNIDFTATTVGIGVDGGIGNYYLEGQMGELYFDTVYTNLPSDNPFWDADANLLKPVQQVLDETGNTPLIAMPILSNDPGNNLGTGGDFTPSVSRLGFGARGASEFRQRSTWSGSSPYGYLTNNSVFSGVSNSRQLTLFFASYKKTTSNGRYLFKFDNTSGSYMQLRGDQGSGNYWYFNSESAGNILNTTSTYTTFPGAQWKIHAFSVDLTNTSNRHYYSNRASQGMNWQDYANKDIPWSSFNRISIFSSSSTSSSNFWNSYTGPFYMTTEYVDFSDTEKMNLFIDHMGYPKDLTPAIEDGLIPNPVIYLPFDDPNDLGKNLGTGGDFTVNNTFDIGYDVTSY